jgi:hypothetical protein
MAALYASEVGSSGVGDRGIVESNNDSVEFAPLAGYSQFDFPHSELLNSYAYDFRAA